MCTSDHLGIAQATDVTFVYIKKRYEVIAIQVKLEQTTHVKFVFNTLIMCSLYLPPIIIQFCPITGRSLR